MRRTTLVGHTKEVRDILKSCTRLNKKQEVTGMFDEFVCDLYEWVDSDGDVWVEKVQASFCWGGPNIFLHIINKTKKETKGWVESYDPDFIGWDYDLGIFRM